MKTIRIALIILIAVSMTVLSYAAEKANFGPANKAEGAAAKGKTPALQCKPGMKAERGIKNLLFGWTEIPKSIIQVTRDSKNPLWGLTGGTLKGVGKAFPRTVSGAADLISFPMGDYDKMPVHPDELKTQVK